MKYYLLTIILIVMIILPGCGKKAPPFIPDNEGEPTSSTVGTEIEKNNGNN